MPNYYNRYDALALQSDLDFFPSVQLTEKDTDKFEIYELGKSRFDKLSQKYYGSPYWGFLINLANPALAGLEFLLDDQTAVRIPLPLDATVKELKDKIELNKKYYGGN